MTDKTIEETTNLDWAINPATHLWMTFLPTIPGYCHPRYVNAAAEVKKHEDGWRYQIDVSIKENGTDDDLVFLTNRDFNIPNGATARDMKRMVGQLTVEQIKAKLIEKGYQPTYQWSD